MKKLLIHIFAAVLIFTYVFSNVGFAVHKCEDRGSVDVVSLLGDISCEEIHEHSHDHDIMTECHSCSSEGCGTHSENCCETETYTLSSEQDVRTLLEFKKPLLPKTVFLYSQLEIEPLKKVCFSIINYYLDRGTYSFLYGKDKLSVISMWRL